MSNNENEDVLSHRVYFLYDNNSLFKLHERTHDYEYIKELNIPDQYCGILIDSQNYNSCCYIIRQFYDKYSYNILESFMRYAEELIHIYLNDFLDEHVGNEYIDWYHNLDIVSKSRCFRNLAGVILNNTVYPYNCVTELKGKQESYILNVFMENVYKKIIISCYDELLYGIYPYYLDRTVSKMVKDQEIVVVNKDVFTTLMNMMITVISSRGQFVCK